MNKVGGENMNEMIKIPFLQPTINSIRKSIRGIDDSYNNYWDILAELIQNSVDAINKKNTKKGSIEIFVDAINKIIKVKDDGVGIEDSQIHILLSPFSTNKENEVDSIGEKGVGLKFVIFQSNDFKMRTSTIDSKSISNISILGAKTWKEGDTQEEFCLNKYTEEGDFLGTEIEIKGIENDKLFNINIESMKYIIRTKTAIGNVLSIFENNDNIDVSFKMIDINGNTNGEFGEKIEYKYWLPTENVKKSDKINLDDFEMWLRQTDRSDAEKRNMLKNKVIYKSGKIYHANYREIRFWTCFVPKRKIWNDISIEDKLLKEENVNNEEIMQDLLFSTHQPGIYTSVKGMPTGITIEHPNTGYAGYWANIFIIFEDKMLKFDIGRKSINGSTKNIYKEHAKGIFADYIKFVTKYVSGEPEIESNPIWDRDNIKTEIDSLPQLKNDIVRFKSIPYEQEASVAAIFYELIGKKYFEELEPVISGYRNKYDLYAYWKNHFVIIEFKSHLRNIIRDFDDYVKYSNEIDYIVCWDVNDEDFAALHNASLNLEEIYESKLFGKSSEYLPETTHKIIVATSSKPIYVIDLKKVIHKIREDK